MLSSTGFLAEGGAKHVLGGEAHTDAYVMIVSPAQGRERRHVRVGARRAALRHGNHGAEAARRQRLLRVQVQRAAAAQEGVLHAVRR